MAQGTFVPCACKCNELSGMSILMNSSIKVTVIAVLISLTVSLRLPFHFPRATLRASTFDGKEFEKVLKSIGTPGTVMQPGHEFYNELKNSQEQALAEDIFRKYPFDYTELPTLPDCNNYYSGKYGEYLWHQNADQVFVYVPVDEKVERRDIHVNFQAKSVTLKINQVEVVTFPCNERIIPDGSFWTFERDKDGKRFIHLDLEKRYRMINWKGIFGDQQSEPEDGGSEKRSKILEKLFAANQGMSKLSGIPAESMQEMMANGDLTRMIADEVYTKPQVSAIAEDGTESEPFFMDHSSSGNDENENTDDSESTGALDGEVVDMEEDRFADAYSVYDESAYDGGDNELRLKEMEVLEGEIVNSDNN